MTTKKKKSAANVATGKKSKRKGGTVEREVANWLKARGLASARRTQQFSAIADGPSDVMAPDEIPEWFIEVKGTKDVKLSRTALGKSSLYSWIKKMDQDCPASQSGVIIHRPNGYGMQAILAYETMMEHVPRHSSIFIKNDSQKIMPIIVRDKTFNGFELREHATVENAVRYKMKEARGEKNVIPMVVALVQTSLYVVVEANHWLNLIYPAAVFPEAA